MRNEVVSAALNMPFGMRECLQAAMGEQSYPSNKAQTATAEGAALEAC